MLKGLKQKREQRGISRKVAANKLDVPLGTYRNWEQCVNSPKDDVVLKQMCKLYDCTAEELIFGVDDRKEEPMPRPATENKAMFVSALQAAFVAGDPERYGHLQENPIGYEIGESGCEGLVRRGCPTVNVTGCSCAAIAQEAIKRFL